MGLLSRKKKETPNEPPTLTKLAKMPTEDIYLLMETKPHGGPAIFEQVPIFR